MADRREPDAEEHLWTHRGARLIFGPAMNIQAPPNLSGGPLAQMIAAGINDWGGVSPVTPDHVNPEAPWPALATLADRTAQAGKVLVERLAIYPAYIRDTERWLDPSLRSPVLRAADTEGFGRTDPWIAGAGLDPPDLVRGAVRSTALEGRPASRTCGHPSRRAQGRAPQERAAHRSSPDRLARILDQAVAGHELSETDVVALLAARGSDFERVCATADALRAAVSGDRVAYVVNRNINYTNVCYFRCQFCAFSKGKLSAEPARPPLRPGSRGDRSAAAARPGSAAPPKSACRAASIPTIRAPPTSRSAAPIKAVTRDIHIHAFSPLEVTQGAQTLGLSLRGVSDGAQGGRARHAAGHGGRDPRRRGPPHHLPRQDHHQQWLDVIETAHAVGLRTTATIMYGHVEGLEHWARHLLRLRALQLRTGGLTEFVPLPFVPMEAPIYLHGRARSGPTYREAILMHAVARLALNPHVTNIQTSWVKMGPQGVRPACAPAPTISAAR